MTVDYTFPNVGRIYESKNGHESVTLKTTLRRKNKDGKFYLIPMQTTFVSVQQAMEDYITGTANFYNNCYLILADDNFDTNLMVDGKEIYRLDTNQYSEKDRVAHLYHSLK
jgi:hypothetical protein